MFFKKIKVELLYDPAIPLLGIYPKKTKKTSKDICTPRFDAESFTIPRHGNNLSVHQG